MAYDVSLTLGNDDRLPIGIANCQPSVTGGGDYVPPYPAEFTVGTDSWQLPSVTTCPPSRENTCGERDGWQLPVAFCQPSGGV